MESQRRLILCSNVFTSFTATIFVQICCSINSTIYINIIKMGQIIIIALITTAKFLITKNEKNYLLE